MQTKTRIKATDNHGNVAHIHQRGGDWCCTLANGTPAGFSYAGIWADEMAAIFALQDTTTAEEALAVVEAYGSKLCKYEILGHHKS